MIMKRTCNLAGKLLPVAFLLAACLPPSSPTPAPVVSPTLLPSHTFPPRPGSCQSGMWARQTPYKWIHDCAPYLGGNFIIYSDGARLEEKVRFAEEAEKSFARLMSTMQVEPDELRFPAGHDHIEIFASTSHSNENWGGYAYYVGFLFRYDSGEFRFGLSRWSGTFQYESLFTHEITHTIGYLLSGYASHDNLLVSTWFDEGLAAYIARDNHYNIYTWNQLENLHQDFSDTLGEGNPLLINKWDDIPARYYPDDGMSKLYALFELAVRYLVDTYGMEKCKQVYIDTRMGLSFEESLFKQYGFSLAEFQDAFFTLMQAYLP